MNKQILLIEDEQITGKYVIKALEDEGFVVKLSTTGDEAIEIVQAIQFDLIILDLKLPGICGADLLREIRRIDPYVLVVVYTNYEDISEIKDLIHLGIDEFVKKGADADLWELVDLIKTRLSPINYDSTETRTIMPKSFDMQELDKIFGDDE